MNIVLVADPAFPSVEPWWVVRVPKGDIPLIAVLHEWISKNLFIKDGQNPHMLRAREQDDPISIIRHPVFLGAGFLSTAVKMAYRGDFYVNVNGGMRLCGDLAELRHVEGKHWPGMVDPERRLTIHTWGNHYYITSEYGRPMTFLDKFNTEQEAMDHAKLFALPERISMRREPTQFKQGD